MTRNDVVNTALGEVGYVEKSEAAYKKDPTVLDWKTDGAGADNLTKYARDTGHLNGYAWCQTFIAWIFLKAYGKDLANKLLCGMFGSASTMDVKNAFKKKNQLVSLDQAQAGDIMYRSRSGGGHVELCIGRDDNGRILTVGGNTSASDSTSWNGGQVAKHSGASWEWCARPDYSILPKYDPLKWYEDENGWWYAKDDHTYARNEWQKINHRWYYFNDGGYAVKGHQVINGKDYYFCEDGDLECAMMRTEMDGSLYVSYE